MGGGWKNTKHYVCYDCGLMRRPLRGYTASVIYVCVKHEGVSSGNLICLHLVEDNVIVLSKDSYKTFTNGKYYAAWRFFGVKIYLTVLTQLARLLLKRLIIQQCFSNKPVSCVSTFMMSFDDGDDVLISANLPQWGGGEEVDWAGHWQYPLPSLAHRPSVQLQGRLGSREVSARSRLSGW